MEFGRNSEWRIVEQAESFYNFMRSSSLPQLSANDSRKNQQRISRCLEICMLWFSLQTRFPRVQLFLLLRAFLELLLFVFCQDRFFFRILIAVAMFSDFSGSMISRTPLVLAASQEFHIFSFPRFPPCRKLNIFAWSAKCSSAGWRSGQRVGLITQKSMDRSHAPLNDDRTLNK